MIDGDFYDDTPWPGVRAEPTEESTRAPLTRERSDGQRTGTVDQLWELRIADGECPRGSCSGQLDPEGCCPLCGWSLTEFRMRGRLSSVADKPDYLPRLPQALFIDEFAAANIDEEAA
jgi:hypothetical protein